jgi:type II secretion system protein C
LSEGLVMLIALLLASLVGAPNDLVALGVVLSPRPEASVAILRSGTRTRVVGVGERAFGGRILAISETRVSIEFESGPVEVRLAGPLLAAAAPAPARRPSGPARDPTTPAREMSREEVQRRLADETGRILAETTIVPVQDEERVTGFALTRVPQGTLLSDAGLRAGDILTSINDVPIDSFATLMGLWPRLQDASSLHAIVLREGRPVSLIVSLR